jgi:hypothetical protein
MNAAVFVDFENLFLSLRSYGEASGIRTRELSLQVLDGLLGRLRDTGHPMVVGRAYSAFDTYPGVEVAHDLALMGLEPQYVIISHTGKNSADVQLAVDVARIVYRRSDIEVIVIVSGDRDFIPLARQILEEGRELRIVSIPETTSADLRERVGADRFWDALDLLDMPVERQPSDPAEVAGEPPTAAPADAPDPEDESELAEQPKGPVIVGRIPVTWETSAKLATNLEDRLMQCLQLLMRSRLRHASDDIWLAPFLKGPMSQHFSNVVHSERRALINELRNRGIIKVEERKNLYADHPYSVIVIDDEHPMASEAWGHVQREVRMP